LFDVQEKVSFPQGIPGFEDVKEFILEPVQKGVFYWLKAVHRTDVVFLLIDPFVVCPDFAFDLNEGDRELLGLGEPADARVFAMVTLAEDVRMSTANLLGPIIINAQNRRGKQLVLDDSSYRTKHPIFPDGPVKEGK